MRIVLSLLVLMLMGSSIFSVDLSLAPGLSVKNAMLYMAMVFMASRFVVGGNFKMQMGKFTGCYLALIGYAIATWLVAGLVVQYKSYTLVEAGISLKNFLIDPLIF